MILNERDLRHEQVLQIGKQMMIAARTAPKAKGVDIIEVALITDEDIQRLSEEMRAVCEENGFKFFLRDADNIKEAECVLLIGTHELPQGLNCGHCGYATCANRPAGVPCALNSVDVGIAIGSACAVHPMPSGSGSGAAPPPQPPGTSPSRCRKNGPPAQPAQPGATGSVVWFS